MREFNPKDIEDRIAKLKAALKLVLYEIDWHIENQAMQPQGMCRKNMEVARAVLEGKP